MPNNLTTKDLTVLNELILLEYCGNKKAGIHVNSFSDDKISKKITELSERHKMRFEVLFKKLNTSKGEN